MNDVDEIQMILLDFGATIMCPFCRTQYDNWAVDITDYVPPVGDGCEFCVEEVEFDEND